MIDFSKKLSGNNPEKRINPLEIYESLDRASDKGPLRLTQSEVLQEWYDTHKEKRDLIVKLHTGQGKTLIGLLILQSKLNEKGLPVLYICPSKLLVEQTCEQAKQFGIKFCQVDEHNQLPQEFLDGKSILIAHVQLFFNGLSKFGLKREYIEISSIILDDSHACIDSIQDAFTIKIKRGEDLYDGLFRLFESDIEEQGQATTEEIRQREYESFLPVPYWAWQEKNKEVIELLVKNRGKKFVLFAWELIKDIISDCQCLISGTVIEITPYLNPIEIFGSFSKCGHRVFMSATTSNDAFFIKSLNVDLNVVKNPLKYSKEKWSGEKMILIPYLVHPDLNRVTIVNQFSKESNSRNYGVVALTSSDKNANYWKECGAIMPEKNSITIEQILNELKEGQFKKTVVLSNRYDGIDLPDDTCRILILDSKPFAISLYDRLEESYRENSKTIHVKIAQKIEQGLGRAVRGERDYCVVIVTGDDLTRFLRMKTFKKYFSPQTNKQIDVGLDVGQFAIEQDTTNDPLKILSNLILSSLKRDNMWKQFYVQEMNKISATSQDTELLEILQLERKAELLYKNSQQIEAIKKLQDIIDKYIEPNDNVERAYYLQEMARYAYNYQKSLSNEYQIQAYKLNRTLLKPLNGIKFQQLKINQTRSENIKKWLSQFDSFSDLILKVQETISDLSFGVQSKRFEKAVNTLGLSLGFACEMPDSELKRGPDNLWNVEGINYLLIECKNEVKEERGEIEKAETGQMNNACAWFKLNYSNCKVKNVMIIPTKVVSAATGFVESVEIIRKKGLNTLKSNFKKFFDELRNHDIHSITETMINENLHLHKLTAEDILNGYSEQPFQKR